MDCNFNVFDQTIQKYDYDKGDKFAVIKNPQAHSLEKEILYMTLGGFNQAFRRAELDSEFGGFNNDAVADYFEPIADRLFQIVQGAKKNKSAIDFTVPIKDEERRILRNRIAHLAAIMENLSPESERFKNLHDRFLSQLKDLNVLFGLMQHKEAKVDCGVFVPEISPQQAEIKLQEIMSTRLSIPLKVLLYALQKIKYLGLPLAILPRLNSKATVTPYSWWSKNVELKTWDRDQELKLEKKVGELSASLLINPNLTVAHTRAYKKIVESGLDSRRNFKFEFDSDKMDFEIYKKLIASAAANPRCDTIIVDTFIEDKQSLNKLICQHGFINTDRHYIKYQREISEPLIYNALKLVDLCFAVGIAAFGVWLYRKKDS